MKTDISNLTPEEKLDLLTKDFLERDGDHFVRIRKEGRLGWEDTLAENSAYSAMILNPKSDEELVKHSVFVASKVLDDEALTVGKRLDVFLGLAIHEGSHLLYTNFNTLQDEDNPIVHHLQNILEDERIERELGQRKPGLANFIKSVKQYHYGRYQETMEEKDEEVRLSAFARLYNAILSIVRYPSSLDAGDAAHFADALIEIRDLLVPYPETTKECLEKAREIYEIMKQRLEEEQEEQEEQQGQGQGQESQEQQNQEQGQGQNQSADNQQSMSGGESRQQSNQGGGSKGPTQLSDEDVEAQFRDIEDALNELSADPSLPGENNLDTDDMAEAAADDGGLLAKECEGALERGSRNGTVVIRPEEDADAYSDSMGRIRRYIPSVAQALRCNCTEYAYNLTGMQSDRDAERAVGYEQTERGTPGCPDRLCP